MSPLAKTKRQANFKNFKRFGAFKGLVEQKNVVFNSSNKLLFFAYRNESGTRKILVKVAIFYTKNRGESSTFLHHFIPSPWR
jgi:hypothetical protein